MCVAYNDFYCISKFIDPFPTIISRTKAVDTLISITTAPKKCPFRPSPLSTKATIWAFATLSSLNQKSSSSWSLLLDWGHIQKLYKQAPQFLHSSVLPLSFRHPVSPPSATHSPWIVTNWLMKHKHKNCYFYKYEKPVKFMQKSNLPDFSVGNKTGKPILSRQMGQWQTFPNISKYYEFSNPNSQSKSTWI